MPLAFDENRLTLPTGRVVEFPHAVGNALLVGDMCVVLLEVPHSETMNENVLAVDLDGVAKWSIEPRQYMDLDNSPYVGIELVDGELFAYGWDGVRVLVDPESGKIRDKVLVK